MSHVHQFELKQHFHEFVATLVASGQYEDVSQVVREALRLLEHQEKKKKEKLALLKSFAEEGIRQLDQGLGIEFRSREELRAILQRPNVDASQVNGAS